MDSVILAAGANERLQGLVLPYHKPLLVMNGIPIILDLIAKARELREPGETITIVCAPENCRSIVDLIRAQKAPYMDDLRFAVQPSPTGPINALALGLTQCESDYVMMLCGDNVIDNATWANCKEALAQGQRLLTIAIEQVYRDYAERFTTFDAKANGDMGKFFHGTKELTGPEYLSTACWVGPVIMKRGALKEALKVPPRDFATLFNRIGGRHTQPRTFVSHTLDIGVPEALQ